MTAISRFGQPFDKLLADEDLSDLLTEKGFAVARRTVTKYRELLGIPKRSESRLVSSGVLQWFLREYMTGISALPPCSVG